MHFLDINTFYAEKAGGIKTYHRAKLGYFLRHPEHTYTLVAPGPDYREQELAENVRVVEVYGPRLSRDAGGYRLLLDFPRAYEVIRHAEPDVLEVGDPWLTGAFSLFVRHSGLFDGLLASFHHSDAMHTWVEPWARHSRSGFRERLAARVGRAFYGLQRRYDVTLVSSHFMEDRLLARGVRNVVRRPFGTDPLFFDGERRPRPEGRVRLLYAGRLGVEKGAGLLLDVLPKLMEDERIELTVLGRGKFADDFCAFVHPRYTYGGYLADRHALAEAYRQHDVFLAPGPHETFGLGVLEAMASGLVVVGPDQGGTAELLRDAGSPFVFASGDADAFLGAVRATADADLAPHARAARQTAERYGGWDDAIGRMVAFYEARLDEARVPALGVAIAT